MKIAVVTTEKKLTQSLIRQMPRATLGALQSGCVLGWVQLPKVKVAIIQHLDEHYTQTIGWYRPVDESSAKLYRAEGGGTYTKPFESVEKRNVWWKAYLAVTGKAEHIYI